MADDIPEAIKPNQPETAITAGDDPRPAAPIKGPVTEPEGAKPAAQALKDGANKLIGDAGGKARSYAEEGKARAGGALDELSKMMNDAAGQVDDKLGAQYGNYARSAADAISGFSESLKAKQIDDLVADARGFVKKSPAVAIGAAAAIGFVLSRILKSGFDGSPSGPDRDRT